MIRLQPPDLEGPMLAQLAAVANLSAEAFKGRFLPTVQATTSLSRPTLSPS